MHDIKLTPSTQPVSVTMEGPWDLLAGCETPGEIAQHVEIPNGKKGVPRGFLASLRTLIRKWP